MQKTSFTRLLNALVRLNPQQIKQLDETLCTIRRRVDAVIAVDSRCEGHGTQVICQECGHEGRTRWGKTRTGAQRWRCKRCSFTWSGLTSTPLAGVHRPDLFLELVRNMIDADKPWSCRKAAAALGISRHTVWRWRMRIIRLLPDVKKGILSGIVEADEARQRESRKASREWVRHEADPQNVPKPPRERWRFYTSMFAKVKTPPGGWQAWNKNLLAITDRSGNRVFEAIPSVSLPDVQAVLLPVMAPDAVLCTDGHATYERISKDNKIPHFILNRGRRNKTDPRSHHINTVGSLQGRYREFMDPFCGPATLNLKAYGRWFAARENARGDYVSFFKRFLEASPHANTVC
jgi:transposase-like protein